MEYIATFFTHSGAIRFERFAKEQNIKVQLMPVPRKLSSSCGIAAKTVYDGDVKSIIIEDIDCLYDVSADAPRLLYKHS